MSEKPERNLGLDLARATEAAALAAARWVGRGQKNEGDGAAVNALRLLLGTFFAWITAGWLPMPLSDVAGAPQIAFVFVFYGLAFASMSACMGGLYLLAWRRRRQLALDADRAADAMGEVAAYGYFCAVGMLSALVAIGLPEDAVPWQVAIPGTLYFLLSLTGLVHVLGRRRARRRVEAEGAANA